MNYTEATYYLNISEFSEKLSLKRLKQCYHTQSLLHHPDKNKNSRESAERFKKINEAYTWLCDNIDAPVCHSSSFSGTKSMFFSLDVIIQTLNKLLGGETLENDSIKLIIDTLSNTTVFISPFLKKQYLLMLTKANKKTCYCIYSLFMRYQSQTQNEMPVLAEWMKDVAGIKSGQLEVIILTPTIDDLFEAKLIKLFIYNIDLIIPTWNAESIFDIECPKKEVRVICQPLLPKGVTITDDTNNLYIQLEINHIETCMSIKIGTHDFNISLTKLERKRLFLTRQLTYTIQNSGVPRDWDTEYNIINRSDIFINIKMKKDK